MPRPCRNEDRPGCGPSMVSVAGGRTVPCCSGPKVAALTAGTLLLLTAIGAASWAIGESGSCASDLPWPLQTPACLPSPLPSLQWLFSSGVTRSRSTQVSGAGWDPLGEPWRTPVSGGSSTTYLLNKCTNACRNANHNSAFVSSACYVPGTILSTHMSNPDFFRHQCITHECLIKLN